MADPITLTAAGIAALAFDKAFGKTIEKLTEGAIAKITPMLTSLQQKILARFKGNPKAEDAVLKEDVDRVAAHLQVMMDNDPKFSQEVEQLATAIHQEINIGEFEDNSSMTQINRDQSTGYQTKTGLGNTNFFGGTHHYS